MQTLHRSDSCNTPVCGSFRMRADKHYPEEAPVYRVTYLPSNDRKKFDANWQKGG
jgi:hypothetical protein